MIYAQQGTVMVEGHGRPDDMLYAVTWLDPQGCQHQTPKTLLWGQAWLLADKLDHGEPYVPTVH